MKKNTISLIILSTALTLSSCGLFNPSSKSESSSSKQDEPSISSNIESSSNNDESTSSSIDSSESSSGISSSSSNEESSSASSSSNTSSSISSSSEELSSSSSSASSSSSSSSSSSESSSSSSLPDPEPELTPQHASITYNDLYQNLEYLLSVTPSTGDANILVIPVWFTDSSTYIATANKENVREDIHTAYFGTNEETGWRSVKTYYEEESHGALSLNGVVSDWYECNKASTYYGNDASMDKTLSLVISAADWYFKENPSASRLDYDNNKDGFLDGVMLIYGAPDSQALGKSNDSNYDNLWAYCYWVQEESEQNVTKPGANAFFWASYDFMYDKTLAASKTGISKAYHSGDNSHCNIDTHTYIHEMGHMFGLNDYYDYSSQYNPAGGFSMQDANVGGHDPFSAFTLGWGKAYIPETTVTINLKPFVETGEMILLSPNYNEYNSPFDEYLLLEFYTPTGLNELDSTYRYLSSSYPKGPQDMGIRLWHVDGRLCYEDGDSFAFTTNAKDDKHQLREAFTNTYDDGSYDIEDYLSPLGSDYSNFDTLHLIRNNTTATYKTTSDFNSNSMFKKGSSFTMNTYKKQFPITGKLDQNINLGFSFSVDNITSEYATITVTKL